MALTIKAPDLERRVREAAGHRGMTAEEYLKHLIETHLLTPGQANESLLSSPQEGVREWLRAFDAWIDGHAPREALPEHAFDRASFYEGP